MSQDWQTLTKLTSGASFTVERVRMTETGVAIEGAFDPPALAQLSSDDQVFVAAFVRCHGSIKDMEKLFGVSYPTIKNRLNRIGAQLPFAEVDVPATPPRPTSSELLTKLERGEITARDVIAQLKTKNEDR
jgi:hypothetical protein